MGFFPRRGQMDGFSCLQGLDSIEFPPHAEGTARPKNFFANVAMFIPEQELIMGRKCPPARIRLAILGRLG